MRSSPLPSFARAPLHVVCASLRRCMLFVRFAWRDGLAERRQALNAEALAWATELQGKRDRARHAPGHRKSQPRRPGGEQGEEAAEAFLAGAHHGVAARTAGEPASTPDTRGVGEPTMAGEQTGASRSPPDALTRLAIAAIRGAMRGSLDDQLGHACRSRVRFGFCWICISAFAEHLHCRPVGRSLESSCYE